MMLRLEALPARYGDCLWIEYGSGDNLRRILIDGGAPGVYRRSLKPRLLELTDQHRLFELLVVTHVDYDHIRGIIELAYDDDVPFEARDIWFNGWRHLPDRQEVLAGKHGERLTDLIRKNGRNWNHHFNEDAVVVPKQGSLPTIELAGGLKLRLLSPTLPLLADLVSDWRKSCEDLNLTPEELEVEREQGRFRTLGDNEEEEASPLPNVENLLRTEFEEDHSAANGSSIAFVLEYEDTRLLLSGDAHPGTLVDSLKRIPEGERRLDACKLPHHGSRGSVSAELIKHLDCQNYIFSSNGDQFRHPHHEAVARVIEYGGDDPLLLFNYRSKYNEVWEDAGLQQAWGYRTQFPDTEHGGLVMEWGQE